MTKNELVAKLERLGKDAAYVASIVATRPEDAARLAKDLERRYTELADQLTLEGTSN